MRINVMSMQMNINLTTINRKPIGKQLIENQLIEKSIRNQWKFNEHQSKVNETLMPTDVNQCGTNGNHMQK